MLLSRLLLLSQLLLLPQLPLLPLLSQLLQLLQYAHTTTHCVPIRKYSQTRRGAEDCARGSSRTSRRTLGDVFISKAHLPWYIKAHLGTSRRTLAHQGAPWVSKVRSGKPMRTLAAFCIFKARLGRIFYFQGAPWHIKAHLGTSRCTLAHQGAP